MFWTFRTVTNMEQMSIWDILDEGKSDFPCDTCKHDVKGCCDYNEPLGKTCVLGSAYESNEWIHLTIWDYIEWNSEFSMPLISAISESNIMTHPDVICEGTVNGTPAYIGFKAWVSGPGECFLEYEAIQWKEK